MWNRPVVVRVATFVGESADHYEFVNPHIEEFWPTEGPKSGGTLLTIRGKHMNAGSSIRAVINPNLECHVLVRVFFFCFLPFVFFCFLFFLPNRDSK